MRRKICSFLVLAAAALILCGCKMQSISDLYTPPKRSDKYNNLQSLVQKAMTDREYCAPVSGENQQTVQSADLNGDGEDEYLLFARDSSDKPLKIFIFALDGDNYALVDTIESAGSSYDRVEYVQMDQTPGCEIVVGRQVSDQVVRSVSVYSFSDAQAHQLLSSNYSTFLCCDMDADSDTELFVLRSGETGMGVAALYDLKGEQVLRSEEVNMSEPAENIKRVMFSRLLDGGRAVYVASAVSGSSAIITDVFALQDGSLCNISLSSEHGTSIQTLRNYYIYAEDIDGDGVLELPSLVPSHTDSLDAQSTDQHIIRWYSLSSDASQTDKLYTYHNLAGGWYLELDETLAKRCCVEQKGSSYIFSVWDEGYESASALVRIYVLTGQKREEQAVADNRFVLCRTESTIYAADLELSSSKYGMTREALVSAFHLIVQDWKTGET